MTRAPTRTTFHSSGLVRILTELAAMEAAAPASAFAEKLGLWVDYSDAITLCAVHNNASPASAAPASPQVATVPASVAPAAAAPASAAPAQHSHVAADFARQRAVLERAIQAASLPEADLAAAQSGGSIDITAAFEPYRRYYVAQQRDMELKVAPLRSRVREELARGSPALRQLAALDAALDGILNEREGKLLGALPQLLKRRFGHLLRQHRQQHLDTAQADKPDLWLRPGAWLARFGKELQTVLLAELDLRLQPALGLMEALQHEPT